MLYDQPAGYATSSPSSFSTSPSAFLIIGRVAASTLAYCTSLSSQTGQESVRDVNRPSMPTTARNSRRSYTNRGRRIWLNLRKYHVPLSVAWDQSTVHLSSMFVLSHFCHECCRNKSGELLPDVTKTKDMYVCMYVYNYVLYLNS